MGSTDIQVSFVWFINRLRVYQIFTCSHLVLLFIEAIFYCEGDRLPFSPEFLRTGWRTHWTLLLTTLYCSFRFDRFEGTPTYAGILRPGLLWIHSNETATLVRWASDRVSGHRAGQKKVGHDRTFIKLGKIVKNPFFRDSDSPIVFGMCDLIGMHLWMWKFAKKYFRPFTRTILHFRWLGLGKNEKCFCFFWILNNAIVFKMVGLPANINF